jgi:rRNA maturation endonuclease Nob1
MKVCAHCGSENVFRDALVSVNDPTDVRVFDLVLCDDCGGETSLTARLDGLAEKR